MKQVIIIRYSEIYLKGKNRGFFEQIFANNLEKSLKGIKHEMHRPSGRYIIDGFEEEDAEEIISRLKKVFGLHTLSLAYETGNSMEEIFEAAKLVCAEEGTFKVESHRGDKRYPLTSVEISKKLGGMLLSQFYKLKVDVHNPDVVVKVEIREYGAYISAGSFKGAGGMPVGTNGRGLLLLSGGIDSPVAGYMMAKRGVKVEALHFESFPYTSERAREKVLELASILAEYAGEVRVHIVSLTHIQEELVKSCNEDYFTLLLRRYMMTIAERVAKYKGCTALITGESLGQVASQTMQALGVTDSVVKDMPVFRPLHQYG